MSPTGSPAERGADSSPRRVRARRGHGDELRNEILDATDALIAQTGDTDKVSIRAIAQAVGVTPPSIYLHFADKDALLFATCNRHFRQFRDALRAVDDPAAPARTRLRSMGRAYIEWGIANPEAYRVMFMDRSVGPPPDFPDDELHGKQALIDLAAVVAAGIESGDFRNDDITTLALAIWAAVHGVTALQIAMDSPDWDEHMPPHDHAAVVEAVLDIVERSITT